MKRANWFYRSTMRALDLVIAIIILIALSWLLMFIYFWIKFETPGPAIFRQKRVGLNGEIFVCNKFRTMHQSTDDMASHLVSESQVTRSGKFLRKTKLDELPQAWNILRNEMSIVGPRPCLPSQSELISQRNMRNVLTVKPGITGLSQIRNIDMSDPVKLAESDAEYLSGQSIILDIKIMISTALGKGQGDKISQAG